MKRQAFTLIEAVFSMLLVSVLLVVALNTAGASARLQSHGSDRGRGQLLAQALMSEILLQAYQDTGPNPTFGPKPSEITTPPSRVNFSDVDDYNGWTESPPQYKNGSVIPNWTGWGRSVKVVWVNSTNLATSQASETNIKLITITVTHNNTTVATCVAIKANN